MSTGLLLPTFFIIGAPKAGTTSLNHYMGAHPEIAMTRSKDPHVMTAPRSEVGERLASYLQLFPPGAAIRGECSVGYAAHPVDPDSPRNIVELVPEAGLIYLVRDPVERTIAHYAQHVITEAEARPPEEAIRVDDPHCLYVAASRYATQVEVYLEGFAMERILVIDMSELRERRRATLRRVFAHVGADPEYWDEGLEAEHNVRARDNVLLGWLGSRLERSRLNEASRRVLPARLRRRAVIGVRRGLGTEVRPDVSPELRARLAEALAPEAERLRKLTGRELAGWSV
jgi:hypothetical protein